MIETVATGTTSDKPSWLLAAENRLPFWICDSHIFHSKIMALEYATRKNTDIDLYFNDIEFS
jgi:hypothetical protein